MCGRYSLTTSLDQIARRLGISGPLPPFPASVNVAPTQSVPVVVLSPSGQLNLQLMRWGLVPHWTKNPAYVKSLINARCETITSRSAFRDAFHSRRCLIPADGFYEWATLPTGRKQPYLIARTDGQLLFMAGLYDLWQDSTGRHLFSTAVITVPANSLIAPLHDRMPAILPDSALTTWLDPARSPSELLALLSPVPGEFLRITPVDATRFSSKDSSPSLFTDLDAPSSSFPSDFL